MKQLSSSIGKSLITAVVVAALLPLGQAFAGNKELMTVQKAKDLARRAIVESTVGLKIRSNALWADQPSDYYEIQSKVAAAIKGIEFDTPKYDKEKDIGMVTAKIRLGSIENIIGRQVDYDEVVIQRVGFATSSPEYQPALSALRAAELNAYDEMAKLIVGQEIQSESKVRNFVLENDKVRTRVLAAIWGAEVKEFGWQPDGNAFVTLRMNVKWVQDVVGQRIRYTEDNYVQVTGYGSPVDDLRGTTDTGGSAMTFTRKGPAVEQTTFDIPAAGQQELKGAPTTVPDPTQPATGGSVLIR